MGDIDVAHLKIQGVDVVIAFLNSSFEQKVSRWGEMKLVRRYSIVLATQAWRAMLCSSGRILSAGSSFWHRRISTLLLQKQADYHQLYRQINKRLSCG